MPTFGKTTAPCMVLVLITAFLSTPMTKAQEQTTEGGVMARRNPLNKPGINPKAS